MLGKMPQGIYDIYLFGLIHNCEIEQEELGPNQYLVTLYCAGEPITRTYLGPQDPGCTSQGFPGGNNKT